MPYFCDDIENKTVYPILIKNNRKNYFTLYYYTEYSDSILHNDAKQILWFLSIEDMKNFCEKNELNFENEMAVYDFEAPIENPVDYKRILENWNLLDTIANIFKMFFDGKNKKYDALYDLLFRLNTPLEPIPPMYLMSEKNYKNIQKIFKKKNRFLDRFELYQEK